MGVGAAAAFLTCPAVVLAQGPPAPAEPRVTVSGYVQPRYDRFSADGVASDRVILRRAVLGIDAELAGPWEAELALDAGPVASAGERLIEKDALLRYTGWSSHGVSISIGNQKTPFSQSSLQSASRRSHVERPFTGDGDFGAPGRAIALRADGWHREKTIGWSAAIGSAKHAPAVDTITVDGIATSESAASQGRALTGRVELHPAGQIPRTQGDLERGPLRYVVAAAAYRWTNDNDITDLPAPGVDARSVEGVEISAGLRGAGLSVDAEYQRIAARLDDRLISRGLYIGGEAELDKASIEAGYLVWGKHLEATTVLDALGAEAFETPWRRAAIGMNWYVNGHALKFSVMHRESFNTAGIRNARSRVTYVQSHFAF